LLISQIGGTSANKAVIAETARGVFPDATARECSELAEIMKSPGSAATDAELLILVNPDAATLTQARNQLDEARLPRWAVVVVESTAERSNQHDVMAEAELIPTNLAQVLRSAWERHRLRRENAMLRGALLTFGSRIAHDLRTPLGGVLTTTEMLREVLAEDAPADVPLTQPILDSTDGLVKLIERSSFFARATASREPAKPMDMGDAFWSAFQHTERALLQAQLSLKHPPVWPKVMGHESWLEMAWGILLSNAVQHTPSQSWVEAGWSKIDEGQRFWVRSGGKVPVEKRASLFFPFHRMHEPGAPRGLGLPMLRGLVELDGGWCGFEDLPSGGVEFYFVLPAQPGGEVPEAARAAV
jgi:signal transduction histidine kinase